MNFNSIKLSAGIVFATVMTLPFSGNLQAQNLTRAQLLGQLNTITTAVPFLMITPDSRAGGMGETGVATTPDVNSIHWNAAKLPFAEKKSAVGISYTPWLRALVPDINLAYLSFYTKVGKDKNSAIGGSMRYFSMGNITFTDVVGNTIGQFRPNEFAFDGCYARRLSDHFSASMTGRFVRSNLTNGISVANQSTKAGTAFAVDLGAYYHNDEVKIVKGKESTLMFGIAITNMGNKVSYSTSVNRDFIPINLRLGAGMQINADDYNKIGFQLEFNKLLVPSPPVYAIDANGNRVIDPNTQKYVIAAGKDPDVSVPQGMIQSFYDAPAGFNEELKEINMCAGVEYWYNNIFAVRTGYFYEAKTKGNRQFLTLGAGVKYHVFGLDFAYLIPTNGQRSPLQNTLRFTLTFDFDSAKSAGGEDAK
ncbi:MAG: type IX secretion system outer membrane channel protein PorV [Bacteroidia bacterium]